MDLAQRVVRSTRITFVATLASAVIQAGIMVVLIRQLTPSDYGIYAVAFATAAITAGFVAGTVERTLMVSPHQFDLAGRTIPLFLLPVSSGAIALAIAAVANVASVVAYMPLDAFWALLLGQCANGFGVVARVHLRRKLHFGWITVSELVGQLLGNGAVAITLAYLGYGYDALLAGAIVQGVVVMTILQLVTPKSLIWPVRWRETLAIGKSALSLAQSSSLEVVRVYLPVFILGRLGDVALGLFNRSYSLVHLPLEVLSAAVNRVAISALVEVGRDRARLINATKIYVMLVSGIVFPIAAGVAGASEQFTRVIMGGKWLAVIPLVPWIALAAACLLASRCLGILGESLRAFRAKALIEFTSIVVLAVTMLLGSVYGLLAGVIGMGLAGLYYWIAHVVMAARLLQVRKWVVIRWHLPALVAAVACFVWSATVGSVASALPSVALFVCQVVGCAVLTSAYYAVARRSMILAMWRQIHVPQRR